MCPILFKIGPFHIYSYGLFVVIAFFVSLTLVKDKAKSRGVNPDTIINLSFLVFISGIIGARLFYVFENIGYYLKYPLEIVMLQHGGLSWHGGLVVGIISAIFYIRRKSLSVYKVFDLISPFVALGQSIGRIGCLLNGCCYGKPSPYGIYFRVHEAVIIPTQLYSSLILIIIFFLLRLKQERPHKEGSIFYTYLLAYSLKRFLIEFWRAEHRILVLGLNLFQLISLFIFLVGVFGVLSLKKKS